MLETDQTPRPIAPGPPLLTAWRQVETFLARPLAAKRFGGSSSGKSQSIQARGRMNSASTNDLRLRPSTPKGLPTKAPSAPRADDSPSAPAATPHQRLSTARVGFATIVSMTVPPLTSLTPLRMSPRGATVSNSQISSPDFIFATKLFHSRFR